MEFEAHTYGMRYSRRKHLSLYYQMYAFVCVLQHKYWTFYTIAYWHCNCSDGQLKWVLGKCGTHSIPLSAFCWWKIWANRKTTNLDAAGKNCQGHTRVLSRSGGNAVSGFCSEVVKPLTGRRSSDGFNRRRAVAIANTRRWFCKWYKYKYIFMLCSLSYRCVLFLRCCACSCLFWTYHIYAYTYIFIHHILTSKY